jgi:predicted Zn-dependent protease with MMP-like domain
VRRLEITGKVGHMEPVDVDAFEALVADALATIPDELRAEMENVAIIIDDESPPGPLYGLYEGVPLTRRGTYGGASPDRITLFLATICRSASTTEDLARRVRVTLLHEVGHHFGMGEARLREIGWA